MIACDIRLALYALVDNVTAFYIPLGDIDYLAVERGSPLAGSVEEPLERRQGCIESIRRAVIDLAGLCHGLLGKGAHASGTAVSRPR